MCVQENADNIALFILGVGVTITQYAIDGLKAGIVLSMQKSIF